MQLKNIKHKKLFYKKKEKYNNLNNKFNFNKNMGNIWSKKVLLFRNCPKKISIKICKKNALRLLKKKTF